MTDELQWMHFETKMRMVIHDLMEPIIEMSQQDRSGMIEIKQKRKELVDRIELLEQAVFNMVPGSKTKNSRGNHKNKTLFDEM